MQSSIDELVNEILKVNHAWKTACDLFERDASLSISLQEMKNKVQLLRVHHPKVFLEVDPAEAGIVYGLRLQGSVSRHYNAAHLPEQVARQLLYPQKPEDFLKHSNLKSLES
jgi:hypothetical protein